MSWTRDGGSGTRGVAVSGVAGVRTGVCWVGAVSLLAGDVTVFGTVSV